MSYNEQHPELRPGEVWLANGDVSGRQSIKYESMRVGWQAYDIHGKPVRGLRPVFVSKKEYEEKGKNRKACSKI